MRFGKLQNGHNRGRRCCVDDADVACRNASYVEPDQHGRWFADLSPVGGANLGPFLRRSDALVAEQVWLKENWL
jgi:hypothetical protein